MSNITIAHTTKVVVLSVRGKTSCFGRGVTISYCLVFHNYMVLVNNYT